MWNYGSVFTYMVNDLYDVYISAKLRCVIGVAKCLYIYLFSKVIYDMYVVLRWEWWYENTMYEWLNDWLNQ